MCIRDRRTFNADIGLLNICLDFRSPWPRLNGGFGQNGGRGGGTIDPNELVFTLGVLMSVPIVVKIDHEMRP